MSGRRTDAQLVHYLAIPPVAFPEITKALGRHDLAKGARVVYEKPVLDMLVTHLFQVAAEVAMEPPAGLGAADLQAARER